MDDYKQRKAEHLTKTIDKILSMQWISKRIVSGGIFADYLKAGECGVKVKAGDLIHSEPTKITFGFRLNYGEAPAEFSAVLDGDSLDFGGDINRRLLSLCDDLYRKSLTMQAIEEPTNLRFGLIEIENLQVQ